MNLEGNGRFVRVPANTEVVFCTDSNTSTDEEEINGFGLKIFKQTYPKSIRFALSQFSSTWLLFQPCERMKRCRNDQVDGSILLENHHIALAFGSLISPYQFKCADPAFVYGPDNRTICKLFFAKYHSCVSITMGNSRFTLKCDHIDRHRGVIINIKSISNIVIHICLRGNLEEYKLPFGNNGRWTRRFELQTTRNQQWQPCFSAMHLSIWTTQNQSGTIYRSLCNFIQFFNHHSIPIQLGSIGFSFQNFIYQDRPRIPTSTFIGQYAWQMLNSVGCRMYDQLANNRQVHEDIFQLSNQNNGDQFYYVMERLRRLALSAESYFLSIVRELPAILTRYHNFYLDSIFYQTDMNWPNYVRIPWFCLTPTRLIIKPFKFMRSNRVFRHISNLSQCMAFVEFRDDTGSAYLSADLVPFLKHYLQHGFHFGGRHYIYLHHAQSQIRNKQFYFYCPKEGGMTREELEKWMGDFDGERLPAKNTARRTQPFSSTDATIEIDKKLVDTIPDVKTADGKYNFTDGVGQISAELNLLIHNALDINAEDGDYVSSVLQIRYDGCKGTIAVNPHLDGKKKQLLIRPSMNKFKCDHQMLELCKRSMRRHLCLNREVINLLSYRGISSERLLVFQLRNILWLISALVSNQSALEVLREKVLHVFSWSEISGQVYFSNEPFFRRLLHTTISNNFHQLVTRAHIRVPQARYMFGIVDEYRLLEEGQVFVQITNDDGEKIVLEGPIAITKNPCRHPGDLRVLQAVNIEYLHHLYDVLVFPQKGSRPHASEISGSDLDGDEYTVIWNPDCIPTSINPTSYNYDSGPAATPLERVVTRADRLQVILDICEQDNLGRLSNIHLVLSDKFGIDSDIATSLAAGLSQELDSVKSGQHPYTSAQIKEISSAAGATRPDFMQAVGHKEYQSEKILGKLFRSAHSLSNIFSNAFPMKNDPVSPDATLLHDGYEEYIDFAQELYHKYQNEMLEIIGSYGCSNEIDLFCCLESRSMNANERSDIQQTVQKLLKDVFQHIRRQFREGNQSFFERKARAAACYYVAYTDEGAKDKRMLSFPWLFASNLLANGAMISEDEETNDYMENELNTHSDIYQWLKQRARFILKQIPNKDHFTLTEIFEICFQSACDSKNEQWITLAEILIEQLIKLSNPTRSN